jgi:hypothetical protein
VPLCEPHHQEQHTIRHPRFDARYGIRLLLLVRSFVWASQDVKNGGIGIAAARIIWVNFFAMSC